MSGTDFYYPNMVELAEKLAAIAPGTGPKRVYFGNSGTEAIEAAIKLARYHTRREKIIAFYGAFHGRTMGSLSLTASKAVQRRGFGALLSGVFHVPYANPYRCPYGQARRNPAARNAPRFSSANSSARSSTRRKSRRSSSNRFRAKADTFRARRVPARTATHLPPPRHSAGRRRGAERHGPHRQVVGGRPRRHRARHPLRRQGHRLRHAAFGNDRARRA